MEAEAETYHLALCMSEIFQTPKPETRPLELGEVCGLQLVCHGHNGSANKLYPKAQDAQISIVTKYMLHENIHIARP